jgi:hypothetical protein
MNVYAYAYNSPFMVTDRDGRCPMCAVAVGIAIDMAVEYILNGDCATWKDYAFAATLGAIPGITPAKLGIRLIKHHSVPSAIIKRLPRSVANNPIVRGARGQPNIRGVPKNRHDAAHSSPKGNYFRGGNYNRDFDKAIRQGPGYKDITPQQVRDIANNLMNKYFGL